MPGSGCWWPPASAATAPRALADGFAAYLRKPVAPETLLDCLRTLRARPSGGDGGLITVHSIREQRPPALQLLLADDNPVNCRLATIILERGGHKVDAVPDGLRAVEALHRQRYDLVLLDVQMPVMGGLEAAARIRAMPDPRQGGDPDRGGHRQCHEGRPRDLPRRGHGRLRHQADQCGGAARRGRPIRGDGATPPAGKSLAARDLIHIFQL